MAPLFLIGFMAAGKTSVGRAIARATGRQFIDLDDEIAAAGTPVAELVARDEAEFRRREADALAKTIASAGNAVIATGGGAAAHGDNLARMRAAGLVVALAVDVAAAEARAAAEPEARRPLLASARELAARRAPVYRRAHAVVDTTGRTVAEVAEAVCAVERAWRRSPQPGVTMVALGERSYPISVGDRVDPAVLRAALGEPSRVAILTDTAVARHWLAPVVAIAGPGRTETIAIPPGEAQKSFASYERICNQLVAAGLDRGSVIIALGGGVVGDLAGFVAASLYRGVAVIQLPTTIVAMTDAAIGGKTAIDLPAGKNLVGAFWQPRLVGCALDTLVTLPGRERRAGFGELWKYALLDGAELWTEVVTCAGWAAGPDATPPPPELRTVIERAIAFKAAVVGRDERELTGHRALLNLGHTVGHAIESATGMLHGEAVGLGLIAACRVSAAVCGTRRDLEHEVVAALRASGLPGDLDPYLTDDVLARIWVDKKRIGSSVRFLLIREVGVCEPAEIAITELRTILRPVPAA
ncbi:MAG: bifunctional shikimate kinase/3-dehydroquinate synthase [Deltaproteobacteria bacterium]|nr:MAG: bifunctional shikimate kinase/3-dehydroquinate synthase [Deltaproteobacteria bacterium]